MYTERAVVASFYEKLGPSVPIDDEIDDVKDLFKFLSSPER